MFEHDFTVSLVSKDSSLFSECSFLKISLPFRFHGCESLSSLRMLTAHLCDTSFCSYPLSPELSHHFLTLTQSFKLVAFFKYAGPPRSMVRGPTRRFAARQEGLVGFAVGMRAGTGPGAGAGRRPASGVPPFERQSPVPWQESPSWRLRGGANVHRAFATRTPLDSPLSTRRLTFTPCDPVSPGLLGLGFDLLPLLPQWRRGSHRGAWGGGGEFGV